jgi:hypothetical protein
MAMIRSWQPENQIQRHIYWRPNDSMWIQANAGPLKIQTRECNLLKPQDAAFGFCRVDLKVTLSLEIPAGLKVLRLS